MREKTEIRKFMLLETAVAFALFLYSYDGRCDSYNTTLYAFNYGYGFISRAFIGTIYKAVDIIMPQDMYTYAMALRFTQVMTAIFFIALLAFFWFCLRRIESKYLPAVQYTIIFFTIFTVTMFSSVRNFGRVDIYMIMCSMAAAALIISDRALWLTVPITAVAVMVHQGYVFMFFNIVLVLLIYRFLGDVESGGRGLKYALTFVISFVTGSALFLYFEFFSRTNGYNIISDVVNKATAVSFGGQYHDTLIAHEILNVDLAENEWNFHLQNFVETPVFILLLLPYIICLFLILYGMIHRADSGISKIKYTVIAIGSLTIVPNFILKIDYARWTMSVIAYYCVVFMALAAMGDEAVSESLDSVISHTRQKSWGFMLLAYTVFFIPLWDVFFGEMLKNIADWLNVMFLHIY